VPFIISGAGGAPMIVIKGLLFLGLAISIPWFCFVMVNLLIVSSRLEDRRYRLYANKYLSREYRQ
jgi:hypothetical protein